MVRTFHENNNEKRRQLRWCLSNGSTLTKGPALEEKKVENDYTDVSNNQCMLYKSVHLAFALSNLVCGNMP